MFCKHCGKDIIGNGIYCSHCGAKFDETVNESNRERRSTEGIENEKEDKEDKEEKNSNKKKFNSKIAIIGAVALAVVASIALFSVSNKSIMNKIGNTNNNIINDGIATIDENNWIYYSNGFGKMYKMKNDGSQESVILDVNNNGDLGYVNYEDMNVIDGWIYYVEDRTYASSNPTNYKYRLYKLKTDGSGKLGLSNGEVNNCGEFNVVEDWIYYEGSNGKDADSLYKIKTDGSNNAKIATGNECYIQLNVVGDWIFYSGKSIHYKVKMDGTMNSKII